MTKKIEALKLALEGVEIHSPNSPEYIVCAALIQALAQTKHNPVGFYDAENKDLRREIPMGEDGDWWQPVYTHPPVPTAQPEQPKVRTGDCLLVGVCASEGHKIQKAQPEQEPVAWMYQDKSTHQVSFQKHMKAFVDHSKTSEVPLYGKPLANHELQCVCGAVWCGDEMVHLPNKTPPQPKQDKERCVGCEACIDTACGRDECPKGWPKAAQPEQEPVAWVWKDMRGQDIVSLFEPRFNSVPLYTTPPQRTWVGLNDDDKKQIAKAANYNFEMTTGEYAERIGRLTEEKLKELNT